MEERHHDRLRAGLDRLPQYDPPPGDWDALDRRLRATQPLHDALERLPAYDPPAAVWTNIERGLRGPRRVVLRRWIGAAAAAVIVLLAAWQLFLTDNTNTTTSVPLTYRTEVLDDRLLAQVPTDEDDAYFARLVRLCDEQPIACRRPDVQSLQAELIELNAARDALQAAIGTYGADPDLLRQLTDIELDRTRVARALLDVVV